MSESEALQPVLEAPGVPEASQTELPPTAREEREKKITSTPEFQKALEKQMKIEKGLLKREGNYSDTALSDREGQAKTRLLRDDPRFNGLASNEAFEAAVDKQMEVEKRLLEKEGKGDSDTALKQRRDQVEIRLKRDDPRFGGKVEIPTYTPVEQNKPEKSQEVAYPHITKLRERIKTFASDRKTQNLDTVDMEQPSLEELAPLKDRRKSAGEWLRTQPNGLDAAAEQYITNTFGSDVLSQMRGIEEIKKDDSGASKPTLVIENRSNSTTTETPELEMPELDALAPVLTPDIQTEPDPKWKAEVDKYNARFPVTDSSVQTVAATSEVSKPINNPPKAGDIPDWQNSVQNYNRRIDVKIADRLRDIKDGLTGLLSSLKRKKPEQTQAQSMIYKPKPELYGRVPDPAVRPIEDFPEQPEVMPTQMNEILEGTERYTNGKVLQVAPVPNSMKPVGFGESNPIEIIEEPKSRQVVPEPK